jgi:hypothetical protein
MHPFRVTIAQLILVVVIAAIGFAAIRSGSPAWSGALFSITLFAMICSLLGIALGRGTRRVYWSGFATLGWSYLLLIYVPWLHENVGQYLLAPNLFEQLEVLLQATQTGGGGLQSVPLGALGATATAGGFGGAAGVPGLTDFVRIGTSMEALLWAFLGGWAARYFASGRDQESNPQPATSTRSSDAGERPVRT